MTDLSIVDDAFDSVGSAGGAALDTVVGGAAMAVDTASRPRRTAGRARRRGSEINEEIADTVEDVYDTTTGLPERVLLAYVRTLRSQARRDDPLGAASRTILGALHGSARDWARFFGRVERETDVRGSAAGRRTSNSRTATGRRTTARGTATSTRGTRGRATSTTRGRTAAARRTTTSATATRRTGGRRTTRRSA